MPIYAKLTKNSTFFQAKIRRKTVNISKCHKPDLLQSIFSENIGLNALENPNLIKSDLCQLEKMNFKQKS